MGWGAHFPPALMVQQAREVSWDSSFVLLPLLDPSLSFLSPSTNPSTHCHPGIPWRRAAYWQTVTLSTLCRSQAWATAVFTQVFSQTPKTSVPWTALLQWRFPSKPPHPHSHGSTSPGIPPEPPIQAPWSLNSISQPPCPSPQCYCPDYGVYPFSVKIHGFYQLFT